MWQESREGELYLVPETGVVKPLQEFLAHDHGAGEEGPVG